jgi:hypothetical protein
VTGTVVADVTARGEGSGTRVHGIGLSGSGTSVTLLDVTARAEGSCEHNYGLKIESDANAIVRGGSFAAREASIYGYGIYNLDGTLEATGASASAEGPGTSRGLWNNATAVLRGGSFGARAGGSTACGIQNDGASAILEAESATAKGLDATSFSYGLRNTDGASATLHGGSFTAGGGSSGAYGVYSTGSGTVLRANGISAFGEGSAYSYGLYCPSSGSAYVTLSVLEGSYRSAYGNADTDITHSRLVDGDVSGTGTVCIAVSWGATWYENTCP